MRKSPFMVSLARWRQWFYPREFRIEPTNPENWSTALVRLLEEEPSPNAADEEIIVDEPNTYLDNEFVVNICNQLFRARKDADAVAKEEKSTKEIRSLLRAIESAMTLLQEKGVECFDLAGQDYHQGRVDFSPARKAEEVPGLDTAKVAECKRPAVYYQGKLLQKATGVIARPAKITEPAEFSTPEQPGAIY